MNAQRTLALSALTLIVGCTTPRPIPDASPDVVLAPIDSGVSVDSGADAQQADQGSDGASPVDAVADASLVDGALDAGADGAARDGGRPRCDSDAGLGEAGCVLCPSSSSGLLNQCTSNGCARFDTSRCGRLLPDGGLPPLP